MSAPEASSVDEAMCRACTFGLTLLGTDEGEDVPSWPGEAGAAMGMGADSRVITNAGAGVTGLGCCVLACSALPGDDDWAPPATLLGDGGRWNAALSAAASAGDGGR